MKLGLPILKRHVFLGGVHPEMRAVESGERVRAQESRKKCHDTLQRFRPVAVPQNVLDDFKTGDPIMDSDFGIEVLFLSLVHNV